MLPAINPLRNLASQSLCRPLSVSPALLRSLPVPPTPSLLPPPNKIITPAFNKARMFSASNVSLGVSDKDLAKKLDDEYKYEVESDEGAPEFLTVFQKSGLFKIQDTPGEKEVKLTRTLDGEKISILFSTDSLAESDWSEEAEGAEAETPTSVNCTVLVDKGKAGTLEFAVTVDGGEFMIDTVAYGKDSSLMVEETAEADWKRKGTYGGPVFQELDEELQDLLAKYLEERGFDESLAEFIPKYVEFKEQKEYENWLKSVRDYVLA
ncbi:Mitochondrial acidic protein mam33 [Gonapodya sp. JEL0774]|nr:Mitochondrial acidic protein mam33 [Gonapodya sp. JEL0774]